jgi:hypothetical protein
MKTATILGIAGWAFPLLLWADEPQRLEATPGAATPEAVWEKARAAYREGDFRTFIGMMAPAAHDECLCDVSYLLGMAFQAERLTSDQDMKELNVILRKYGMEELRLGVPPGKDKNEKPSLRGRTGIHLIQDKAGVYSDVMTFLRKHKVGPALSADMSVGITEVKIDGTRATAPRLPERHLPG